MSDKITPHHQARKAILYIRQSSAHQVQHNLELIGATESHELSTPTPAGWDRVSMPVFNSGLLFPVSTLAAAKGQLKNCNLGGTLNLLYRFSEPLRSVGAKYYRLTPSGKKQLAAEQGKWERFVRAIGLVMRPTEG